MIATVSPADSQYHHTVNTLKYADRAKEIKTNIQVKILLIICISIYVIHTIFYGFDWVDVVVSFLREILAQSIHMFRITKE